MRNTNAENTLGTAVSYLTTKFRQHDTVNGIFTGKLDNLSALCFRDTLNDQDVTKIAEADVAFHDVIYTATDNQKLILLLNNLREQMYRYRVEYLKKEEAYPQLIAEHEELIDNISKRNKEEATRIMCEHIDNQVATVINVIHTKKV